MGNEIMKKTISSRGVAWIGVSVCLVLIILSFISFPLNEIEPVCSSFYQYLEFLIRGEYGSTDFIVDDNFTEIIVEDNLPGLIVKGNKSRLLEGFLEFIYIFPCVVVVLVYSVKQLHKSYRLGTSNLNPHTGIRSFVQRHIVVRISLYCVLFFVSLFYLVGIVSAFLQMQSVGGWVIICFFSEALNSKSIEDFVNIFLYIGEPLVTLTQRALILYVMAFTVILCFRKIFRTYTAALTKRKNKQILPY